MIYTTLAYDLANAVQLAPSDRVKFLRQEFGINTTLEYSAEIIVRLLVRDYAELYKYPDAQPYLESVLDRTDLLLIRIFTSNQEYNDQPYPTFLATNWDFIRYAFHKQVSYVAHFRSLRNSPARYLNTIRKSCLLYTSDAADE